jgi:hypothetical protein
VAVSRTLRLLSGSEFPVGFSGASPSFQASDTSSNVAQVCFAVHVRGADEQVAVRQNDVGAVAPGSPFYKLVTAAGDALARGKIAAACGAFNDLRGLVASQSGNKLDMATAGRWLAAVDGIRFVLACS